MAPLLSQFSLLRFVAQSSEIGQVLGCATIREAVQLQTRATLHQEVADEPPMLICEPIRTDESAQEDHVHRSGEAHVIHYAVLDELGPHLLELAIKDLVNSHRAALHENHLDEIHKDDNRPQITSSSFAPE